MHAFKACKCLFSLSLLHFVLAASFSISTIERKRMLEQSCRLAHLSVYLYVRVSVCMYVCPVDELCKNGWFDLDALWSGEWIGRGIRWEWRSSKGTGSFGNNVGHPIV